MAMAMALATAIPVAMATPCSPSLPPRKPLSLAIATPPRSSSTASRLCHSAQQFLAHILHLPQPLPHELPTIQSLKNNLSLALAPSLCLAAIGRSTAPVNTPLTVVASGMAKWLELYSGVLMVRVLLSWFPNIPWERQPLQAIRDMCDPYLNLFRNIIPPLFNALDVSPLLAFLVLGMLTSVLNTTIQV